MFRKFYFITVVSCFSRMFGQCSVEPYSQNCNSLEEKTCLSPAFNAPARIEVQRYRDFFFTMSFLYWVPYQENMEIGFTGTSENLSYSGDFVNLNFEYKPGFRLGIGYNLPLDHWDTYLEYTWFHPSVSTHIKLDATGTKTLYPSFIISDVNSSTYLEGREYWDLNTDLLDLALARRYYVGCDLTFHPFLGLRAARINQDLKNEYIYETTGVLAFSNIITSQSTSSWGIGPKVGLQLDWLLGLDIRMYGITSGDILFTQYTDLKYSQFSTDNAGIKLPQYQYEFRQNNINYLRTHFDLELGLGWGTYFACDKWHIDLNAGYSFQVFFDQNCFRNFLDDQLLAKSIYPNGNLYIHGLNATIRFDF